MRSGTPKAFAGLVDLICRGKKRSRALSFPGRSRSLPWVNQVAGSKTRMFAVVLDTGNDFFHCLIFHSTGAPGPTLQMCKPQRREPRGFRVFIYSPHSSNNPRYDLNARRADAPIHDSTPTLLSGCNPVFPASQPILNVRVLEVSKALRAIWLTEHSPRFSRLTKPLHLVQYPTHTHILHDGPPPQEARRTSPIKPTRRPTNIQTRLHKNIEVQDTTPSCQKSTT